VLVGAYRHDVVPALYRHIREAVDRHHDMTPDRLLEARVVRYEALPRFLNSNVEQAKVPTRSPLQDVTTSRAVFDKLILKAKYLGGPMAGVDIRADDLQVNDRVRCLEV
jgi:hypothetical protein